MGIKGHRNTVLVLRRYFHNLLAFEDGVLVTWQLSGAQSPAMDAVFPHLSLRRAEKCDIFSETCLLSGEWASCQVTRGKGGSK